MSSMMCNTVKMRAVEPKMKLYETVEQEPTFQKKPELVLSELLDASQGTSNHKYEIKVQDLVKEGKSPQVMSTVSPSPIPLTAQ
jgi:hypothetical protein